MPKETDNDSRVAKQIGTTAEQVVLERNRWDHNHVMRAVFKVAIDAQIEQRRTSLETASPEHLKSIQGEIVGLRTARGIVLKSGD